MKFECEGKTYELTGEPTTRAVEQVLQFEQGMMLSYIDLSEVTEVDKKKELAQVRWEQLCQHPERMGNYLARQQIAEVAKTVMLCTGMTYEELQDAPLRPLYQKCKEILGGTASDFFSELQMSSDLSPTPTPKKSSG